MSITTKPFTHSLPRKALAIAVTFSLSALVAIPSFASTRTAKKAPSITTIQLGVTLPIGATIYPLIYANSINLWKKYHLNVVMQPAVPSAAAAALYSNSVNISFDGAGLLTEAVLTHSVELIGTYGQLFLDLVASPKAHLSQLTSASDFKELNGLTVGISTPGSSTDTIMRNIARTAHITLNYDYLGQTNPATALAQGVVQIATSTSAQLGPVLQGGNGIIGNLNKLYNGRGLYTFIAVNKSWAKSSANRSAARRFAEAYRAAIKAANQNQLATAVALGASVPESTDAALRAIELQKATVKLIPFPNTELSFDLNVISPVTPQAATTKHSTILNNSFWFKSDGTLQSAK